MKKLLAILTLLSGASAWAAVPDGYYSSLEGLGGRSLEEGIEALSRSHVRIPYGDRTWKAFETTDTRMFGGSLIWWDMYSNNLVRVADGHDALNREHSVANSWWGGKNGSADAYGDLFLLNPSDQDANNRKGSNPPGRVSVADILDNGLFRVGKPVEGDGGGSANVFEPADEYKGDFARAYFYVFTAYRSLGWLPDAKSACVYSVTDGVCELQPWARRLLLEWHAADPVDSKEISRNEEIYKLQHNRNPFIDCPGLADYVWGENAGNALPASALAVAEASDRPAAPRFLGGARVVGVDTYTLRWWEPLELEVRTPESGRLMVSIDGGKFYQFGSKLSFDGASGKSDSHTVLAYTATGEGDNELRSSVARLDLVALDPDDTDYSAARWKPVPEVSALSSGGRYVILSSNTSHAMSVEGGSGASSAFMRDAGFVDFYEGEIYRLPLDAAVVTLAPSGEGYVLGIHDRYGEFRGYWNTTADRRMSLDPEKGTVGTVSFDSAGDFVMTFGNFGRLQFNRSQPRFLNYSSSQGGVRLYAFDRFDEDPFSGVCPPEMEAEEIPVGISGCDIIAPEGSLVFDLDGRQVSGRGLAPGVYIVRTPRRAVKVML